MTVRVLLIHGVATTSAIWAPLLPYLRSFDVLDVNRPRLGDMDSETRWLADYAAGAFVVGISGGATLGLALASSSTQLLGALVHEPAVGSLAPGLLDPIVAAYAAGGTAGFGAALYGPGWTLDMAPDDAPLTPELAMFRAYEPAVPAPGQGPVIATVGDRSLPIRHASVAALSAKYGYQTRVVVGSGHFAPFDAPKAFAALIAKSIEDLG
jgi:pimeloyl-ACP methyl ester carboxylesterase